MILGQPTGPVCQNQAIIFQLGKEIIMMRHFPMMSSVGRILMSSTLNIAQKISALPVAKHFFCEEMDD